MRTFRSLAAALAVIACAALAPAARAATGYAMVATGVSAPVQAAAFTGDRIWKAPAAGDFVLSYPSVPADSTTISWPDSNLIYREWTTIPDTYGIQVCTVDLAPNQVIMPAGGSDQCAPDSDAVKKPFRIKTAVTPASTTVAVGHLFISWTLPTAGCTTGVVPCDNISLTGDAALTSVQVFVSTSPIAVDSNPPATLILAAGATQTNYSVNVTFGTTLYVRLRAANQYGSSPFSDQVYKAISLPDGPAQPVPAAPTGVNITIQFTAE